MHIIVNGFDSPEQVGIVENILRDFSFQHLHLIAGPREERNGFAFKTPHTVLYIPEIIDGIYPAGKDTEQPLDAEILNEMLPYEADILRMMDRFEVYRKRSYSYDERKDIYFRHLRYWNHVLRTNPIKVFISANIPHDIYDYVIYALCKSRNIPTIFFYQSQIKDSIHPMTDWKEFTADTPLLYRQLLETYKDTPIEAIPLSPTALKEWTSLATDAPPFYMAGKSVSVLHKLQKGLSFGWRLISGISNINGLRRRWDNKKLDTSYQSLTLQPDYTQPYFYFPLHYQPELTSCPLGGPYVDQILIAELVDNLLPDGYQLYIKEHPKQEFASRYFGFYERLLERTTKTRLVPKSCSSFELMRQSKGVVTITGTAGWEALFRDKPVLLFGHNFYQHAPGVWPVYSLKECKEAIHAICEDAAVTDKKALKLFLKAADESSIKGFSDMIYAGVSDYDAERSRENIYSYLKQQLKQL